MRTVRVGMTPGRGSGHRLGDSRGDVVARTQRSTTENSFVREHRSAISRQFGIALLELLPLARELVPVFDGLGIAPASGLPAPRHLLT